MGFHKRYITKDKLLENIHHIDEYLNADALVMDSWSVNFCKDINKKDREIRKKIIYDTGCWSGSFNSHVNYSQLVSLSEALISLSNNPSWVDIQFTIEKLNIKVNEDEAGIFDILKNKCINSIINYYAS